jgi:hypothetical protein
MTSIRLDCQARRHVCIRLNLIQRRHGLRRWKEGISRDSLESLAPAYIRETELLQDASVSGSNDQTMQYLTCCIEIGRFDGIISTLQMMCNDCRDAVGAPRSGVHRGVASGSG